MKILLSNLTKMVNHSDGVAKVVCAFANEMVKRGHTVSIIHSDEQEGSFFFPLNKSIKTYNAKKSKDGSIIKFPFYLRALREVVRPFNKRNAQIINRDFDEKKLVANLKRYLEEIKPDIIVSCPIESSILFLRNLNTDIPVITMSHGSQRDSFDEKEIYALENSVLYQVLLPSFEEHIKKILPKVNVITMGNAVPSFEVCADLSKEKEQYKIIFVGRLSRGTKRPHIIIQAFAKLAQEYPNWIVELWGAKERPSYYEELVQLIKSNRLGNRVFLKGTTNDVPSVLRQADIFAFPSYWEGFSLALTEGMSMGLPAIGFKNCPGTNELIKDGVTGFLCDDGVENFSNALEKLISNKELRVKMGKAATQYMKQYETQTHWDKWEEILRTYINGNR